MSATNQPEDLDEPSKYAPKWIIAKNRPKQRTAERCDDCPTAPQLVVSRQRYAKAPRRAGRMTPSFEGDLASKRMRIQRSLEPGTP